MSGPTEPLGVRIRSVNSWTSTGGAAVKRDTIIATIKLKNIPKVPIPSGEIPHQKSSGNPEPPN